MNIQFGVLDNEHCHIDTSNTLRGAMIKATKDGYHTVSCRFNGGYQVITIAHKKAGKWCYTSCGMDLKQRGII